MYKSVKTIIAIGLISVPLATIAVAAEKDDTSSSEPTGQMKHGEGMMHSEGMMHGGNMPMMAEMNKMMKNCNAMMERMMDRANSQDGDSDQS